MDSAFEIQRTPGLVSSAFLSCKEEIKRAIIRLSKEEAFDSNKPIKFKISCDGTRVSRVSNYVVISFSTVTDTFTNSHFEQKTLGVLKCDENYENLYKACGPLFSNIEQVYSTGEISVAGQVFNVG